MAPAQLSFERGWFLRPSRALMPPGSLIDCTNCVPNEFGALVTRPGQTALAAALPSAVHSLYTMYTAGGTRVRYQANGTDLRRNFTTIIASGLPGNAIDAVDLREFSGLRNHTYFAAGQTSQRLKDDGTTLTRWGIEAPVTVPTVAAATLLTRTIDDFNSVTVDTDYTPSAGTILARSTSGPVEGASALNVSPPTGGSGTASKTIAAIDLTTFATGEASTDDDFIRWFVRPAIGASIDRVELALNFSAGTQFGDGFFTTTIRGSDLNPAQGIWNELKIRKRSFTRVGLAAGGWAAINGIRLTVANAPGVGMATSWDHLRLQGGSSAEGSYQGRLVFVRKAVPTAWVAGQWTNGTTTYTDDTTDAQDADANDFAISSLMNNDGHMLGASDQFSEVVYVIGTAHTAGAGVAYAYEYWNGSSWATLTLTTTPNFGATGNQRLRFTPPTNWVQATPTGITFSGLADANRYWIRVRATDAPDVAALANILRVYPGTVVARGNPGTATTAVTADRQALNFSGIPDPSAAGVDNDPQVTHIEVYRNPNTEQGVFYLDDDVPVGTTTFSATRADSGTDGLSGRQLIELDNYRPPAFVAVTEHQNRIWGVTGTDNRVYFTKSRLPEQVPLTFFVEVGPLGDITQNVKAFEGVLYVYTEEKIYEIIGSDETTYLPRETNAPTGLRARHAIARGLRGIYYYGWDAIYRLTGLQAVNVTDGPLYSLFHGATVNGFAPINSAAASTCVMGWFESRLYFAYPSGAATQPDRMLVYDEGTDTWYPDSRGFRRFFYERQEQALLAGDGAGVVQQLVTGTQDNGVDIAVAIQTRDEDEGAPDADKQLAEAIVDVDTSNVAATLNIVRDYGTVANLSLGTVQANGRTQVHATTTFEQVRAKALGYRLTMSGVVRLYRILPQLQVLPPDRRALDVEPTDLGHPGDKRIQSQWLDIELLTATSVIFTFYADGVAQPALTHTTAGRTQVELFTSTTPFECRLMALAVRANGTFRLWPGTTLEWVPLPERRRSWRHYPTDLGHVGTKRIQSLWLDVERLTGTQLSIIPDADTVAQPTIIHTTAGRTLVQVLSETAAFEATLMGLTIQGDGDWRLWNAWLEWVGLPESRRSWRLYPSDLGHAGTKRVQSLWLDVERLSGTQVEIIPDAETVARPTITHTTSGRVLTQVLGETASFEALLAGVTIQGNGLFRLWDVAAEWMALPEWRRSLTVYPSDLGHRGSKRFQDILLETELRSAGTLTITPQVDTADQTAITITATAHTLQSYLTNTFDGRLFALTFSSPVDFRLWSGSVGWTPLPEDRYAFNLPPSDLGWPGYKVAQYLTLDLELLDAGMTLTPTVVVDNTDYAVPSVTATGRQKTRRLRLPREASGRLVGLRLLATGGRWRLWGGELGWTAIGGTEGLQRTPLMQLGVAGATQRSPLLDAAFGRRQRTPLLSVPTGQRQRTGLLEVPTGQRQRTPLVGLVGLTRAA